MSMEATGKIHSIGSTQQVSDRFSKREIIIELTDNPKYPQHVTFQSTGDRCADLDGFEKGDDVRIEFSLRGRLYTDKKTGEERSFTNLDVWKIARVGAAKPASNGGAAHAPPTPAQQPIAEDDIPF
jgi:single-strand DNA-binding protein